MLASVITLVHAWLLLQFSGLTAIADANKLSESASRAMAAGRYGTAAADYNYMVSKLGVKDDAVLANMGQAYLRTQDLANASRAYRQLTESPDPAMRSLAHNQMAVIASRQKNDPEAADQLKRALREDPNNQLARLNLSKLLQRKPQLQPPPPPPPSKEEKEKKKKEQEQKDQQKKEQQNGQQPKDQQNSPQNPKDQPKPGEQQKQEGADKQGQNDKKAEGQTQQGQDKRKEGAQGGRPTDSDEGKENKGKKAQVYDQGNAASRQQLKEMQLPEARARQLLEAMKTSETQYIQQRRHKRNSPSAGSGKPDW